MKHSESEVTLTRPALYSIYDKDVTNTVEDYKVLKQKFITPSKNELSPHKTIKIYQRVLYFFVSCSILFWMGVMFAKLSTELYDNKSLKKWMLSYTLVKFTQWSNTQLPFPTYIVYGILGVLCGTAVPILDKFLLSEKQTKPDTDLKAVLKCFNALFGICLGIRTIQWSSSLQASSAWGLLNLILWLYFDGTLSVLLLGSLISGISVAVTYLSMNINESVPWFYLLYIVDFYFLSYLVFGKTGRYLLQ